MSGFGIRALKKVADDSSQETKQKYVKNVVVGNNFSTYITYKKLTEKFGSENVLLLTEVDLTKSHVEKELACKVNTLRDETVANQLIETSPRFEVIPSETKVSFYKDGKFHFFGGRAKPYTLLEDEEFFSKPRFDYNLSFLVDDAEIKFDKKYISEVFMQEPTDLVEPANFKLQTGEFESILCENLYWCKNPKDLYKKIEDKSSFSDSLGEMITSLSVRSGLCVRFKCSENLVEKPGTYFLPQSATHEWGHFICDFKELNSFCALMFVNEDELNEEELAKKIKLMSRVIDRVFNNFSKTLESETLFYSSEMFIKNINDNLGKQIKADHPHLNLVGQGATLDSDIEGLLYGPREILTSFQI